MTGRQRLRTKEEDKNVQLMRKYQLDRKKHSLLTVPENVTMTTVRLIPRDRFL